MTTPYEREVAAMLRGPWPGQPHRLHVWLCDLVCRTGWRVKLDRRFLACSGQRVFRVPHAIRSDEDAADLLHELGHSHDRDRPGLDKDDEEPGVVVSVEGEVAAWVWATETAGHRWNARMQTELARCLGSYRKYAYTLADQALIAETIAFTDAVLRRRCIVWLQAPPPISISPALSALVDDARRRISP